MSFEQTLYCKSQASNVVAIVVPPAARVRAWIAVLSNELNTRLGIAAPLVTINSTKLTQTMSLPERIERLMFKSSGDFCRPVDITTVPLESLATSPTILIDATGQLNPRLSSVPIFSFVLNGRPPDDVIVHAIWGHKPPQLGIRLTTPQGSKTLFAVRIAVLDKEMITRALDSVFRRLVSLLVDATAHLLNNRPLPVLAEEIECDPTQAPAKDIFRQAAHGYLPKIARQFVKPFVRRHDWCIGYRRRTDPERFPDDLDLRPETFCLLPSALSRFYADPFLFEKDGTTFLFFEDYDYAAGKAHISYVTLEADGASAPALALERPYHLSYPHIFSDDGRILMIPETCYNRTIELYEAKSFPHEWSLRSVLVTNIIALDATVYRRMGRWWMFVTAMQEHDSSSWDTVSIFWADAVEGPWHSHAFNPVKYDVATSRPAGALIQSKGRLLRPTQDCSKGYGSALTWCEVLELSETGFAERVVARQACPTGSRYYGLHTYTRSELFEAVDFARTRRR